jgi:hypothetical protein
MKGMVLKIGRLIKMLGSLNPYLVVNPFLMLTIELLGHAIFDFLQITASECDPGGVTWK